MTGLVEPSAGLACTNQMLLRCHERRTAAASLEITSVTKTVRYHQDCKTQWKIPSSKKQESDTYLSNINRLFCWTHWARVSINQTVTCNNQQEKTLVQKMSTNEQCVCPCECWSKQSCLNFHMSALSILPILSTYPVGNDMAGCSI